MNKKLVGTPAKPNPRTPQVEGEVHVGEQVPQDERSPVKLNTGKDKTRMKKGLKCVRNYCFSWAVDIDRKVIEFDKLTFGPISGSRLLDS